MKKSISLLILFTLLTMIFPSTLFAQELSSNQENIVIYYPNGDWQYVPTNLTVPKGINNYLFALENLVTGQKIPQFCYNEFPKGFRINSFKILDGMAEVDIDINSMNKIDEKKYSIDVIKDILSYNIYNFSDDIESIQFTISGKSDNKLNSSKKKFFEDDLDPEVAKIIEEKTRLVKEKVKNLTAQQLSDLVKQENETLIAAGTETKVIVVDPGHGGTDPGAVATYNGSSIYEKNINLAIALAVRDDLQYHGYTVLMTRTTDKTLSLSERYLLANNNNATCFVSTHCNSAEDTSVKGTTCIYPNNHDIAQSQNLANIVHDNVVSYTSLVSFSSPYKDVRNLAVLRSTTMPAIITETGFMSNSGDLAYLANSNNRKTIGQRVGYGTWYWCYWFS